MSLAVPVVTICTVLGPYYTSMANRWENSGRQMRLGRIGFLMDILLSYMGQRYVVSELKMNHKKLPNCAHNS